MTWRTVAGVTLGLLLPAPLIYILASAVSQPVHAQVPEGVSISPMLSPEQQGRLTTYERDCRQATECEPPLGCLSDPRVRKSYCTDSRCVTDAQCPESFRCLPLRTVPGSPAVRYCIPQGLQKEGESCLSIPSDLDSACGSGLLCGDGRCGRPCQKSDLTSCPAGFFCADTVPGPSCRPTCEGRTCPEGQQCIQDKEGASECVVVHGPNCQHVPCPDNGQCLTYFGFRHPGHAWMQCFPECGEGHPPCAEGLVCDRELCRKPCEPNTPNACELGFQCSHRGDAQPWLCLPGM